MGKPYGVCKLIATSWPYWLRFLATMASLFSLLKVPVMAGAMQTIGEEPQDTRALLGSTAVLRCRVQNQNGPVTWTKDRYLLGAERSLPAHPRYTMIGSSAHGEYHLEIRDVHLSDDAEYQCQISATATQPFRKSALARLTVLATPGHPRLTPSVEPISAREGRNVTLSCQTDGSKPPAFISWALVRHSNGSGVVRKLYAPNESMIKSRGPLNDIQSVLEYVPQRSDDGSYLACMVNHETLGSPLVATVQLRIQYPPKVNVTLNSTDPLLEDNRAILACNVDAFPNDNLRYVWYQNQQILHSEKEPYLFIPRLSVSHHHSSVFRCHVDNGVGEGGFSDYTLKMKYKPVISSPLKPELFVNENETVTLRCESDANPPAKIKWYKGDSGQELATGNNLTLHRLQDTSAGTYICKAFSEEPTFEPSSRQFKVFINGGPRVKIQSLVYGRKGVENFRLHCHVRSPPNSGTTIVWKRGEEDIITGDDVHYRMSPIDDDEANHHNILTIRKLEPSDFGIYNCSAYNRFGSTSGITHLVQAEEFPTYAILGVAGGCLAILALALALIIVNRKYLCRSKSSTSGDDHSDVTVKLEVVDKNGLAVKCYPDMYNSDVDVQEQMYNKHYIPIPQDNPDFDVLPPPYPSYYTTSPAVTSTTFVNGIITSANGINHYGHSSPGNGHLSYMTYLDDPLSPTTTTTTVAASGLSEQVLFNGYGRPLSPLSPMTKMQTAVIVPAPAPSVTSSQFHQNHNPQNGPYRTYSANGQQQLHGRSGGGVPAPVDLLSGHLSMNSSLGAIPNGSCGVPSAVHYGFVGVDPSSVYHPLTGYGDQPPYYPSGVHCSPLETVHEVATPDAIDDQTCPSVTQEQHQQHQQRPVRSASSSSDGLARCSSQLSTHV